MIKNLIIECVEKMNIVEKHHVLSINNQNLDINGGQLHYPGILEHKYAILAKIDEKIVGYALLLPSFLAENDLYVMQVAVDKKYQHKGIGSKLYNYAYEHSNGYRAWCPC